MTSRLHLKPTQILSRTLTMSMGQLLVEVSSCTLLGWDCAWCDPRLWMPL